MDGARGLVLAAGVFNAGFAVFHLFFWRLFRWDQELRKLTSLNRAIVQVLNLSLTFVFAIFAYLCFAHTAELPATALGRSLLLLIAVFWLLRAIEQVAFFGLRKPLSAAFLLVFLAGAALHALPLWT